MIIGAHYDHLGLGEQFSMAPSMAGTVHPGADDNASGTAGVLELAEWFSSRPKRKRGVLFLNFSGEELGLLGSSAYVSNPTPAAEQSSGDAQHGHDRADPRREGIPERIGNGIDVQTDA